MAPFDIQIMSSDIQIMSSDIQIMCRTPILVDESN